MVDNGRHDEDGGFKKIFALIAGIHLLLFGGLYWLGILPEKKKEETVVWMNPGSFGGQTVSTGSSADSETPSRFSSAEEKEKPAPQREDPPTRESATPPPTPEPSPPPEGKSEIPLVTPQPTATPRPSSTPTPTPKPTPRPTPKTIPTPTSKSTPNPSPTPKPKATPKPSPKVTPSPSTSPKKLKPDEEKDPDPDAEDAGAEPKAKLSPSPGQPNENKPPKAQPGGTTGVGDSGSSGKNGSGKGGNGVDLSGYGAILQARFDAAWDQPTSEMMLGKQLEVTVKIKIEADGTVTEFEIVEGSGNAVVDESVRAAGAKLRKLPPPPTGAAFSAPVRFQLGN